MRRRFLIDAAGEPIVDLYKPKWDPMWTADISFQGMGTTRKRAIENMIVELRKICNKIDDDPSYLHELREENNDS